MRRSEFLKRAGVAVAAVPFLGRIAPAKASPSVPVNAWPQGSTHPRYPAGEAFLSESHALGWSMFRRRHKRMYPLLAAALGNHRPAHSVRIEWLDDAHFMQGHAFGLVARDNFQQIVRVPRNIHGNRAAECARAFHTLCADIESSLRHGVKGGPAQLVPLRTTMGGVLELLGRDYRPGDYLALRPLRDPVWRVTTYPSGSVIGEWIAEVSLEARPRS